MSYAILTDIGRNKEALALAGGAALNITDIAWGDGDRFPAGPELTLLSEQGRKPVQLQGQSPNSPNIAFFEILLAEPEGPYTIREAGLFDADGDMIAIARYDPAVPKAVNTNAVTLRLSVLFSDLQNIVLTVNSSSLLVPASRVVTAGTGLTGGGDLVSDITLAADIATQAEAQAGTSNTKLMTPLRSKNQFDALVALMPAQVVVATQTEALAGTNNTKMMTPLRSKSLIDAVVAGVIDSAPGALDTLNELAAALGDDPNFATTITGQIAALSTQVNAAGVPIGQIAGFHADTAPPGWLVCDGAAVTTAYPELRTHLLAQAGVVTDVSGDPLLPDYRGEFMRGLDAGRGLDIGRVLGSAQADEFKAHSHTLDGEWTDQSGSNGVVHTGQSRSDGSVTNNTGGSETRPRNIAALICMKAADQPLSSGTGGTGGASPVIATLLEAQAGTNNTKMMTPLRVAQYLAANPSGTGGSTGSTPMMHVRDEKPSGTNGGNAIAQVNTIRDLNTVVTNDIPGASLLANTITLPEGTYDIRARAPATRVFGHKAHLFNVTDNVVALEGSNAFSVDAAANLNFQTDSIVEGRLVVPSGGRDFTLRHYTRNTSANSFGLTVPGSGIEVYSSVSIWKV